MAGKYVVTVVVADAKGNLKQFAHNYEGILWQDFCTAELYSGHLNKFFGNYLATEVKLQKADGRDEYRFVQPYQTVAEKWGITQYTEGGHHFRFLWDGKSANIKPVSKGMNSGLYIMTTGFYHPSYGMVYWYVDADPNYTFYDASEKMFQIETQMTVGAGSFGWFDDWYYLNL